jgi:hypothetical protein
MPTLDKVHAAIARVFATALHAALILGLALAHFGYHAAVGVTAAHAQEAAAGSAATLDEYETLVGPVALYPDELLGIVLPASTYPLQIVQAARFLEKHEADSDLEPDEEWDESVLGLLNYPEVIELMNEDLDWTWALGAAVTDHQAEVMDAVQSFRRKARDAGNLETDEKMKISEEPPELEEGETIPEGEPQQVIVIESSSPEVIYVPTYQPTTVVVYQTSPYRYYYSPGYPYYYRPGAVFWTGMFVGAAVGYGLRWGRRGYGDIEINRNVNVNRSNVNSRTNNLSGGNKWKGPQGGGGPSGGRPGQGNVGSRPGDRPSTGRPGGGTGPGSGGQRPGGGQTRPGETRPGGGQTRPGDKGPGGGQTRPGETRPGGGGGSRPGETRPGTGTQPRAGDRSGSGAGSRDRASSGGRDMTRPSSGRSGASPSRSAKGSSPRGSSVGNFGSGSGSQARSHSSRGHSSRGGGGRGGGGRGGRGGGGRR